MRGAIIQLPTRQVCADSPAVLAEVLKDGVNMALWQRRLPLPVECFAATLVRGGPLAVSLVLELDHPGTEPDLSRLAKGHVGTDGCTEFIADVAWLVSAYACLVDARRVDLRLRSLETAMCPHFHVDRVPLRLVTTYCGIGSQWLREGAMARAHLGEASAEPSGASRSRPVQWRCSRARSGRATRGPASSTARPGQRRGSLAFS